MLLSFSLTYISKGRECIFDYVIYQKIEKFGVTDASALPADLDVYISPR